MSSLKQSLRMKKDLVKCDSCKELDQSDDLLYCFKCEKYYHPLKCLQLNESTVEFIKKEKQKNLNFNSSTTNSSSADSSLEDDWRCQNCKLCLLCKMNINRSTRNNSNGSIKSDKLEICSKCNDGYHRKCANRLRKTTSKNSLNNNFKAKKLCFKCSKLTNNNNQNSNNKLSIKLEKKSDTNSRSLKNGDCKKKSRVTRSTKSSFSSDVNLNGN